MSGKRVFSVTRNTFVAALLAGIFGSAQAGEYSNLYFIGDSLTDAGTFAGILSAPLRANSRFTTNPGTTWAENLGTSYGRAVAPAYTASAPSPYVFRPNAAGNNFAVGSARINAAPTDPAGASIPPMSAQVRDLLARGPLDGSALYGISGGHNDVFTQLFSAATPASAMAAVATAANDLTAQIDLLQSAGARHLIVVGIMDIGLSPGVRAQTAEEAALLRNLLGTFNSTLESGLAGRKLLYFDTGKLLDTVYANPAAYGFTNTALPACSSSSLGCAAPAGTEGYLFADPKHPSSKFHRILSDWIFSSLEAASRAGQLSAIPLQHSSAQWRTLDGRLQAFQNFGDQGQGFFVTGDYASSHQDAAAGLPSLDASASNMLMGYEKAFGEQLLAGVTLGYGHAPFDFGNQQGSMKYDEWALSAFATRKFGDFHANVSLSHAWLDYDSQRNIGLGSTYATREQGNTRGTRFGTRGELGYSFRDGLVVHGPLLGLTWERVRVDGFSENSNALTAMRFGEQTRESLRSRLGWQVAAQSQWLDLNVRPYARLDYEYEHRKDERSYSAGFVNGNTALDMPTFNRTGGFGSLIAGVNVALSKTTRLDIGASTTFGQSGTRQSALSVTLGARF